MLVCIIYLVANNFKSDVDVLMPMQSSLFKFCYKLVNLHTYQGKCKLHYFSFALLRVVCTFLMIDKVWYFINCRDDSYMLHVWLYIGIFIYIIENHACIYYIFINYIYICVHNWKCNIYQQSLQLIQSFQLCVGNSYDG